MTPDGGDSPKPAQFDATLDAWVLGHYADVLAALRAPALVMPGTGSQRDSAHVAVRDAVGHAWTPDRLASWRLGMEADAVRLVDALPSDAPVDLVQSLAEPWSLELALLATGAPRLTAGVCTKLARELFLSAAVATSGDQDAAASDAAVELSQHLASANTLGDASAAVQAFVALSQTLPSLLASAWLALLNDTALQSTLRAHVQVAPHHLPPAAVSELLRATGPARAVFREALADVAIGDALLHAGDRAVLMLSLANHDPARFVDPARVSCTREATGHLAFGTGPHACAGASLVRMALDVATSALLRGTSSMQLDADAPVEWVGGFAIRAPGTLPAIVSRCHNPKSPV